jgi:hypothetical protein
MSDIVFDDTNNRVYVQCDVIFVEGHDLILDSPARRKAGTQGGGLRRALVQDQSDGLTINFNHDYPGGVTLNGPVTITGDLTLLIHSQTISATTPGTTITSESVKLGDMIGTLRSQIANLEARVAKLEAKWTMTVSVQSGFAPLFVALSSVESTDTSFYPIKGFAVGLPLINQALVARTGGKMITVRVILDVIASISPADVAAAQDFINKNKGKPSGGGSTGVNPAKPTPTPAPTPTPIPHPKPPIIGVEAIAGGGDDLFTPMRIYGHGFAVVKGIGEAVALIQVLGGSQAALGAAVSDSSGGIDVTLSLNAHTHYSVFAIGVTSDVASNAIGFTTP